MPQAPAANRHSPVESRKATSSCESLHGCALPAPSGTAKGKVNELGKMLPEYYEARGWTPEGVPTNETLARLDL